MRRRVTFLKFIEHELSVIDPSGSPDLPERFFDHAVEVRSRSAEFRPVEDRLACLERLKRFAFGHQTLIDELATCRQRPLSDQCGDQFKGTSGCRSAARPRPAPGRSAACSTGRRRWRLRAAATPLAGRTPAELAREFIHGALERSVTLEELERHSGRDRWSLSRDFRLLFGTSPYRYLTMRRLDLVRSLKGSRWQLFAKIQLPGALPYIFSGMKVAA